MIQAFVEVVSPIFIVVGVAVIAAHFLKPDVQTVSRLSIYVFTPFLLLDGISTSDLNADELWQITLVAVASSLAMAVIGWGIARLLCLERRAQSAFLLSVVLINCGNYGLPLMDFAYGEPGFQRGMVFFVMSVLVANTLGVFLASRGTASIRDSLVNILKVPMLYGLLLGLLLNFTGTALPLTLQRVVTLLGAAAVPSMLFVLGIQLTQTSVRGRIGPILAAAGTRLLIAPLVALGFVLLFGLTGLTGRVSILQASMPTAVMAGVFATEFDSDAEFTTAAILVSTLLSMVTLTGLLVLLR